MVPMHTPTVVGSASCSVGYLAERLVVCSQELLESRRFVAGPSGGRIQWDVSWLGPVGTRSSPWAVPWHEVSGRLGALVIPSFVSHSFSMELESSPPRGVIGVGIAGWAAS